MIGFRLQASTETRNQATFAPNFPSPLPPCQVVLQYRVRLFALAVALAQPAQQIAGYAKTLYNHFAISGLAYESE